MAWLSLTLEALQEEDIDTVIRAAWDLARADGFLDWRSAVFRRSSQDGNATLFFSPPARALGEALGAASCARPNRAGLHLVAGEPRASDDYFAGVERLASGRGTLHVPHSHMPTDTGPSSLVPV
jgi:hypothetical protein